MRRRALFAAALTAAVGFVLLAAPAAPAVSTVGSILSDEPDAQLCAFSGPTTVERPCTAMQVGLRPDVAAPESLASPFAGVITSWRVRSGPATPGTAAVKLRLRSFRANVPIAASQTVELPLAEPSYHEFKTRIRVARAGRVGLTALVSNLAGMEAGAPVLHTEPGIGELYRWESPFESGESPPAPLTLADSELLLSADVEPDRDHDGYGDETQDHCPSNPEIHTYCHEDHVPPHTRIAYAARQDFLAKRRVVVRLHSSEQANVTAAAQLEVPSRHTIWAMGTSRAGVEARQWVTLRSPLSGKVLAAAGRAVAEGRRAFVRVTVSATDVAGNEGERFVAKIEPKG